MPRYFLAYAATVDHGSGRMEPVFGNTVKDFDGDLDDGAETARHLASIENEIEKRLNGVFRKTEAAVIKLDVINWKRLG